MPTLHDSAINLAAVSNAAFIPAVPNGLRYLNFFGGSLQQSLANLAIPANGSTSNGTPGELSFGMTSDSNNYVTLFEGQEQGSETLFVIFKAVNTQPTNFRIMPLGAFNNQSVDFSHGTSMYQDNGGFNFYAGMLDSNGSSNIIAAGWNAPDGIYQSSATYQAALAQPQLVVCKVDTVNAVVSSRNMSQSISGNTWSASTAIPAGYTRCANNSKYQIHGELSVAGPTTFTAYAALKYNRATTAAEDLAIYTQLKIIMQQHGLTL